MKKALSLILALCLVLVLVPLDATAAPGAQTARIDTQPMPRGELTALPELPAETNGSYAVNVSVVSGSSHGEVELSTSSANARDEVYLLANPDDGYLVEFGGRYDYYYYEMELYYVGMDIYVIVMPDGDVDLEVSFVKAEGSSHSVSVSANEGGEYELSRTSAKEYESVYLSVTPYAGYMLNPETGVTASGADIYYLMEESGVYYYELIMSTKNVTVNINFRQDGPYTITLDYYTHYSLDGGTASVNKTELYAGEEFILTCEPNEGFSVYYIDCQKYPDAVPITQIGANQWKGIMPSGDVNISVSFTPNAQPVTVTVADNVGGTASVDKSEARYETPVTLTCVPDPGYEVESITGVEGLEDLGDNTYTFRMPLTPVNLVVTFDTAYNPITVTVDNDGLGGTAYADLTQALAGDTVTLTCEPEEGYRVARITGVEYTDNGDGTYTFEMPGAPADIRVLFLRQDNPFLDVWEPQYYYDPVLWAVSEGITNGMTPTMFEPGTTCTRAQVVTFLWRAAGKPEPKSTEHPFEDVTEDYYYDAMLWAVENGITNGMSPTTFEPGTTCTRAQVVTFLWRAAGCPEPKATEHPFEDVTVDYYYKAMLWAVENGITNGMSLTTFEPGTTCTRGQVVTFLYRADQLPEPEPEE